MSTLRSLQLPESVRSDWLTTARGKFAMLEAQPARGVADRRPALLVHGYTGSKENFLPVLEPLAAAGRIVVAVDLRGQYQSPHAPDRSGYSAAALAADVLAIATAVAGDARRARSEQGERQQGGRAAQGRLARDEAAE